MPKLSEYKPDTRLFALFVGPAGGGKSGAEIAFPTPSKIYDFDLNASSSAFGTPWISQEHKSKVDVVPYTPHKPMEDFVSDLNSIEMQITMAKGNKARFPCQTLILDSITSISRGFMNEAYKTIGGRTLGQGKLKIRMPGPADFGFKDEAIYQVFDFLKGFPINVIVSAHIVPRYGKPLSMKWVETEGKDGKKPEEDFSDKVEVGEKLSLTDKLSANVLSLFTEVYRFDKEEQPDGSNRFYVKFRGDIARTCYSQLPDGNHDITGKDFYEYWTSLINKDSALQKEKINVSAGK